MSRPALLGGTPPKRPTRFDLKQALVVRLILVALFCVIGSALFNLHNTAQEATDQNREVAAGIEQHLVTQLMRIETALDRADRFPDWDAIARNSLRSGQCIEFLKPDNSVGNSLCSGIDQSTLRAPRWFLEAYKLLFLSHTDIVKPLASRGQAKGAIRATIAPEAVAERGWLELSRMLGVWGAMIAAQCVLVYVVVHHALKPTDDILAGINRLSNGDLTVTLPAYELNELARIAEVFNELARKLQTTTRERAELARQLVDAQERERAHIARELHDDVAQQVAALSVVARSIQKLIGPAVPQATRECNELVKMCSTALRSLRETLIHLRPPEIDELGLVASLQELIDTKNGATGNTTRLSFHHEGRFDRLPIETAAHVYRIAQEAVNNALRHAKAGVVDVRLRNTGKRIELTVRDDGVGPGPTWTATRGQHAGVGLIGMRERIFALAGDFYAGEGPSGGFEVRVGFPEAACPADMAGEAA